MLMRRIALSSLLAAAVLAGCATPSPPADAVRTYSAELAAEVEPAAYPYVAEHVRDGRRLAFVAATHSVDRSSATHQEVRRAFQRVRPEAVIIEGIPSSLGPNPPIIVELARMTDDPAAEPYARGEAGYAASLALADGVPFFGGEPTEAERTAALLAQGFSAIDVFHTDLLGALAQAIKGGEISGPNDSRFEEVFGLRTVSLSMERRDPPRISYEGFADWYATQYGVDYRVDARFAERLDPGADTLVGRIVRAQSLIRDRHLLRVILDAMRKHRRVLVVYGGTHRTTLAQALNEQLGPAVVWASALQGSAPPGAATAGFTPAN
jgi:hypothetical protein